MLGADIFPERDFTMPDDSLPPKSTLPRRAGDVPLAVKDAVREIRFNLRWGARKLVASVEAATHHADPSSEGQPMSFLADSLGLAMRTTAGVLRTVDRTAVHLLGAVGPYRETATPLRSSASYFAGGSTAQDIRPFTHDHFWRYKHWLLLKGWSDVFVHEQGFESAGQQLAARGTKRSGAVDSTAPDDHLQRAAQVVLCLRAASIFTFTPCPEDDGHGAHSDLAWQAALCTVLAGEIGPTLDVDPKQQSIAALVLADEIITAERATWERAVLNADPATALERWMGFTLRHL